jgi:hypothetical protein
MAERQGHIDTGYSFVARDCRGYGLVDHLSMSTSPLAREALEPHNPVEMQAELEAEAGVGDDQS